MCGKKIWFCGFLLALLFSALLGVLIWHGAIAQDIHYHVFAEQRAYLGIPHIGDVLSNAPFVWVGLIGLWLAWRGDLTYAMGVERAAWFIFLLGVFLTGFGSAYYHWHPSNASLVWDRAPMTLAFMALFCAVIAERISANFARIALLPLLVIGLASVAYWAWGDAHGVGDLRAYIMVQFYPVIALPFILVLSKPQYTLARYYACMMFWYLAAKLLEYFDRPVFTLLHNTISGHTLKHCAAAFACWCVVLMLQKRKRI